MNSIIKTFNLLSGRTSRHNRTLRLVRDWAVKLQELLTTYELTENTDFKKLLRNTGKAKFDLTAIYYNGRPIINKATIFKEKNISKVIADVVEETESIRRYLMNPSLQTERLKNGVHNLCSSFAQLKDIISKTGFM